MVCGVLLRRGPSTYDEILDELGEGFEHGNAMIAEVQRRGYLAEDDDARLDITPQGIKCMASDPRVEVEQRAIVAARLDRIMAAIEPLVSALEKLPPSMTDRNLDGRTSVRVEDIAPQCSVREAGLLARWSGALVRQNEGGDLVVQTATRERGELRRRLAEGLEWCWSADPSDLDSESEAVDSGDGDHDQPERTITTITRRAIFDGLMRAQLDWAGRKTQSAFLERFWELDRLPSSEWRWRTAREDVDQHTAFNLDWPIDWVLEDARFNLSMCPDELFLEFLCYSLHPEVRASQQEAEELARLYNEQLRADSWELYVFREISGRPVFAARPLAPLTPPIDRLLELIAPVDLGGVARMCDRLMRACSSDPEQAVGQSKNLVESVCKTILEQRTGEPVPDRFSVEELVKMTRDQLSLMPTQVHAVEDGGEHLRAMLGQLGALVYRMNALRNLYGDGHGASATRQSLQPHHARLVAYAAVGLATFLLEVHADSK